MITELMEKHPDYVSPIVPSHRSYIELLAVSSKLESYIELRDASSKLEDNYLCSDVALKEHVCNVPKTRDENSLCICNI